MHYTYMKRLVLHYTYTTPVQTLHTGVKILWFLCMLSTMFTYLLAKGPSLAFFPSFFFSFLFFLTRAEALEVGLIKSSQTSALLSTLTYPRIEESQCFGDVLDPFKVEVEAGYDLQGPPGVGHLHGGWVDADKTPDESVVLAGCRA